MDYLEKYADPITNTLPSGGLAGGASSSSSVASRLYAHGQQQRNSRRNSFSSDVAHDGVELFGFGSDELTHSFTEAQNEISKMSQRLRELQDLQLATTEEKSRLKTENAVLQERINLYEEQLQNNEQNWSSKLDEEKHRLKDMLARVTREKELEAEKDALRYQVLEGQLKAVQREKERADEHIREYQAKTSALRDQLYDLQADCERLETEKHKLKVEFERYQLDTLDRMENNAEMLEELTRQSDQFRAFPRQGSMTDQIIMLEDELERLKIENRELHEQNRDMQAQILHDSVECGRSLLAAGSGPSLAAEFGGMDSQGLMNALREQELVNQRLRNYVNGILMRIIERHPDILEIKEDEDTPSSRPSPTVMGSNHGKYNGCSGSTKNETKSQPNSPPSSCINNTMSPFQRMGYDRLSLRYLWFGSSSVDNKNNKTNDCNKEKDQSNSSLHNNNKIVENPPHEREKNTGTVPTENYTLNTNEKKPTFAKRLYNSLVGQDWHLFSRQNIPESEEPASSHANESFCSKNSIETVIMTNTVEMPPPDPSPTIKNNNDEASRI